ncbi:MAG: hypothetical protein WCI18_10530 [Pseudomonadota bacterium]
MKFLALAGVLSFSSFALANETKAPAAAATETKAAAPAAKAHKTAKAHKDCTAVEAACANSAHGTPAECVAKLAKGEKLEGVTVTQAEAKGCEAKAAK